MATVYTEGGHKFLVTETAADIIPKTNQVYIKLTRVNELGKDAGSPDQIPLYIKNEKIVAVRGRDE